MRLDLAVAIRGVLAGSARCGWCGSEQVRASHESYEGWPARLLGMRAHRCRACYRHFALPPWIQAPPTPPGGPEEEPEPAAPQPSPRPSRPATVAPRRVESPACTACGSARVGPSLRQASGVLDRVLSREHYRCFDCKQAFVLWRARETLATLLLAVVILVGLAMAVARLTSTGGEGSKGPPKARPRPPLVR